MFIKKCNFEFSILIDSPGFPGDPGGAQGPLKTLKTLKIFKNIKILIIPKIGVGGLGEAFYMTGTKKGRNTFECTDEVAEYNG